MKNTIEQTQHIKVEQVTPGYVKIAGVWHARGDWANKPLPRRTFPFGIIARFVNKAT